MTTTIKEELHHSLGNMAFEFLLYLLFMTVDFMDLWTTCLFWIYEYYF
jgi:hypothetical protein